MKEINPQDPENMAGYIEALPTDLTNAWQQGLKKPLPEFPRIQKILISGMGGSAIGGDLFGSYLSPYVSIPIISRRDYGLPGWADGPDTLVVCSSHSGNTEETLSSFQAAKERGCSLLAISTGGVLQREALAAGVTHWYFNHNGQPRTAIGWSFGLLLALAERLGLIHNQQKDIDKAVAIMKAQYRQLQPESPLIENPAKRLAGQLLGRNIVVFAAGEVEVIARRWKAQINELAKALASFEGIPEMNHNTLAGLLYPDAIFEKTSAIFLRSELDHPRNQKRIDLSMQYYLQAGVMVDSVRGLGDGRLAQLWSLLQFGDYVSYYLALVYGVNPTPVDALNTLKTALTEE
ncbi:MAG: bifunctional phosphoglucose/phosphomannose isomerase [Anaerolineaceae bacterium]|jgi:glucose/mannose-6-phosphate isomerase|nr:bifunctional phosphoglucose/phosphomannose isomerase [Anaerolineaceae bacterium]MDD4043166.1 bifunctional phosphoglucose/phosphomannose isomerase [Anaerolineaceae bacterium]